LGPKSNYGFTNIFRFAHKIWAYLQLWDYVLFCHTPTEAGSSGYDITTNRHSATELLIHSVFPSMI